MAYPENTVYLQKKIRIVVIERNSIIRDYICKTLSVNSDFQLTGEISSGIEFMQRFDHEIIDIVVVDLITQPLFLSETLPLLINNHSKIRTIDLSHFDSLESSDEFTNSSEKRRFTNNLNLKLLASTIRTIFHKRPLLSPALVINTKHKFTVYHNPLISTEQFLNETEKKVLYLVCSDKLTKDIAFMLRFSTRTAERYVATLYAKTKTKTPAGLLAYAIQNNLLLVNLPYTLLNCI